jgi:hypothetical protein
MPYETKQINFGGIDHFLYVRINCLCADLGYSLKDFIEQAYCLLTELIDEKGKTHFTVLQEEYQKYEAYRERTRYAPRMSQEKHATVVDGIHEEMYKHLVVIKDENKFPWVVVLRVLLMVMELEIDKQDQKDSKERELKKFVIDQFIEKRTKHAALSGPSIPTQIDTPHSIDKTKKARVYEESVGIYPEGEDFRGDPDED